MKLNLLFIMKRLDDYMSMELQLAIYIATIHLIDDLFSIQNNEEIFYRFNLANEKWCGVKVGKRSQKKKVSFCYDKVQLNYSNNIILISCMD